MPDIEPNESVFPFIVIEPLFVTAPLTVVSPPRVTSAAVPAEKSPPTLRVPAVSSFTLAATVKSPVTVVGPLSVSSPAPALIEEKLPFTFTFPLVERLLPGVANAVLTVMPDAFSPLPPFIVTSPLMLPIVPPVPVAEIVPPPDEMLPLPDIEPNESVFPFIVIVPLFDTALVTVVVPPSDTEASSATVKFPLTVVVPPSVISAAEPAEKSVPTPRVPSVTRFALSATVKSPETVVGPLSVSSPAPALIVEKLPFTFTFPLVERLLPGVANAVLTVMPDAFSPLPPFIVTSPLMLPIVPPVPVAEIVPPPDEMLPLPDIEPNESVFPSIVTEPLFDTAQVTVVVPPSDTEASVRAVKFPLTVVIPPSVISAAVPAEKSSPTPRVPAVTRIALSATVKSPVTLVGPLSVSSPAPALIVEKLPFTFTFPLVVRLPAGATKASVTVMPVAPPFIVTSPLMLPIVPPVPVAEIVPLCPSLSALDAMLPFAELIVANFSSFVPIAIVPSFVTAPLTAMSPPSVSVPDDSTVMLVHSSVIPLSVIEAPLSIFKSPETDKAEIAAEVEALSSNTRFA